MKKILATLLVIAMFATMGISAYADADIGFTGSKPTIIDPHNPGDPSDPDGPDPDANFDQTISTRSIDFGEQKISSKTMVYNSKEGSRTEEGKTIGILLANADSDEYWQVRVKSAGFFVAGKQTMKGYTLTLEADGPLYDNVGGVNAPTQATSIVLSAADDGTDGAAQNVLTASKNASDEYTVGQWGCNYYGKLKVLANTAKKGSSKAVITWEVNQIP